MFPLPLIAAPAHEWSTLLSVLKQTQQITVSVLGEGHTTVIALDMALLYEKAIQSELRNKFILRLAELHVCMSMICAIGSVIENSEIDDVWTES